MNMTVLEIYEGSDGEATTELYTRLQALGPVGVLALNLFRAHKCSNRAKGDAGVPSAFDLRLPGF